MGISDDAFKKALGEKIRSTRADQALSIRKLALLADMEHHQLLRIEQGLVDIRLTTLRKIAAALKLKETQLLDL